jgi:hypothetical protein
MQSAMLVQDELRDLSESEEMSGRRPRIVNVKDRAEREAPSLTLRKAISISESY